MFSGTSNEVRTTYYQMSPPMYHVISWVILLATIIGLETNVWHSRVREHSRVRSSFVSNRFCSNVTTTCIHKYLWAELIVISFKISYCTYDLAHFEHNSIYVSFQMNVIDTLTKLKRTFAFKLYFIRVWYGISQGSTNIRNLVLNIWVRSNVKIVPFF